MLSGEEDPVEEEANRGHLSLPSTYHELSNRRKDILLKLLAESETLQKVFETAKSADVNFVKEKHSKWLNLYEKFPEINISYQALLSPDTIKIDQSQLKHERDRFENNKLSIYSWSSNNNPDDTRSRISRFSERSSRSNMSALSSSKLRESTRNAEIIERQAALEEEKLKLKFKEERLKLKTKIHVSDAKSKVIEDLEKSMLYDDEVEHDIKVTRQKEKYVLPESPIKIVHESENGLLKMTQELNKPKVEIIKFTGNPMEYKRFVRQFDAKVNKNTDSYDEKMNYLLQFTTGEAYKIALGYSYLNERVGYNATMKEFEDRYGDPDIVANSYVKKALEWPIVKDDPKALDSYSIFLMECQYAIENVDAARVLEYPENIKSIVKKLPYSLQERWRNTVYNLKENSKAVKFENLVNFVRREAKKANDPLYGKSVMSQQGTSCAAAINKHRPLQRKALVTNTQINSSPTPKCDFCERDHWISS
ncbi:uncharacterized protein LOC132756335 [Ruditapes philippinarum]|uniref:uncharacterized protein LOC132756335 n=1 Tax=Ruditapes philippinarum TaxID=129788 RepID=UPI00295B23B9|nr:uncharacterized protein LOC132756335 [Ruditapes philippinarum]